MKIVVLYSGGLDSKILLHYAKCHNPEAEVKCLYYAHGADSEEQELARLPDYVEVRRIDWLGDKIKPVAKKEDPFAGAIYIPGRNLIFASLAACQELADEVWMGTLWDEDNPKGTDKNETFRTLTGELLSYVLSPFVPGVKVRFPFVEQTWTKATAVRWAISNGLTKEDLMETVSCWHAHDDLQCGECKQCFKRWLVFAVNGFEEQYKTHPMKCEHGKRLLREYLDVFGGNRDEVNVKRMIEDCLRYQLFDAETEANLHAIFDELGYEQV